MLEPEAFVIRVAEPLKQERAAEPWQRRRWNLEIQTLIESMIDSLPQKIVCRDLEGKVVFANKAFITSKRTRLEEIVGKRDLDFLPPLLAQRCSADEKKARETGRLQE